jgi:hypothetical protein
VRRVHERRDRTRDVTEPVEDRSPGGPDVVAGLNTADGSHGADHVAQQAPIVALASSPPASSAVDYHPALAAPTYAMLQAQNEQLREQNEKLKDEARRDKRTIDSLHKYIETLERSGERSS